MFDWTDTTDTTDTTHTNDMTPKTTDLMPDQDSDDLDPFLCFPERMTKHQLLRLFKLRHIRPAEELLIDNYDYFNLLALYNRLLLPLPQRKHINNRKSKTLEAKQIECNRRLTTKRKSEDINNSDIKKMKSESIQQNSRLDRNGKQEIKSYCSEQNECKRQRISWP